MIRMSKRVISFFLVLLVLTLTSCSFNPIDKKIKELQNASEVETYTFNEKVLMFMGTYEPEPPSGSNPSLLIQNSTFSNMFQVDHSGRAMIKYNFTVGGNLVFNTTMMGGCPRDYVNATGCLIREACSGSRIVVCD